MQPKPKFRLPWQLAPTEPDLAVPFDFKTYSLRDVGFYFVGLNLVVPLLVLSITSLTLDHSGNAFSLINLVTTFFCLSLSFAYINTKSPHKFVRSGLLIFYLFFLIPSLASFIFQLIFIATNYESQWLSIAETWSQIFGEILVIFLAFKFTNRLLPRFRITLKVNYHLVAIFLLLGIILMFGADELYNLIFKNTPLVGDSNNQNSLTEILDDPQSQAIKGFYIFTLVVFTVLVAPLAEELACRHAWFIGSGSRWLGLTSGAIYFGYLHVQTGDIEHLLSYAIAGLIFGAIFNTTRGNVVYSWAVHATYNLAVLVWLFI